MDEGKLLFLLTKVLREIKYLRGAVVKMIEEEDQAKNMSRLNHFDFTIIVTGLSQLNDLVDYSETHLQWGYKCMAI